jgi:hypothetical protein
MGRYMFIVAQDHPELYSHLSREFLGEEGVEVVLDRRRAERRRGVPASANGERRRGDRRAAAPIQQSLRTLNFALIRAD